MDCPATVRSQATAKTVGGWQGIIPLRSVRRDAELLLGQHRSSLGNIFRYEQTENSVDVYYSSNPCNKNDATVRGTADDVVLKITVTPRATVLVKDLNLDEKKYVKIQNQHPENWVHYINSTDGITVDAILQNGGEYVVGFIYYPTPKDREFRCGRSNPH